jgi:hypothetical protein
MNLTGSWMEGALPARVQPYPGRYSCALGVLSDSMLAVFDSDTNLIWTTEGLNGVIASFELGNAHIKTSFDKTSDDEWQVGFESDRNPTLAAAIRVFSGVFRSVREFLEVRQPMTLVFASNAQDLGELYDDYLKRQDTTLAGMGYKMEQVQAAALTEFRVRKKAPSAWRE